MALELDLLKLRVTESLLQGTIFDGKDVKSYLLSYSGGPFYVLGFYAGDVYPPVPTSIILVTANPEGELSAERIELKDITSLNMLFSGVSQMR